MTATTPTLTRRCRLQVEQLEMRQLLSAAPTAMEQLFLELLNDARANPAAYGASIGLDLSNVAPAQPLAMNPDLVAAARTHSADMAGRNYFGHSTPEGIDPSQQIMAAGYDWYAWGQSIAAGFPSASETLKALIIDAGVADLGHRKHLLAMNNLYAQQNEVGVGILNNTGGAYRDYYTIDTGRTYDSRPFVTGVAYNDANANGRYDIGEGLGNVRIEVKGAGSTTTWETGGYSLRLSPGTYTITASGGSLGGPITRTITVGKSNVRMNFNPSGEATVNYVTDVFQQILGRAPSSSDLAAWTMVMMKQGPMHVVDSLERSAEARTRLVRSWYQSYLGRTAQNGEEQWLVGHLMMGATESNALAALLGSAEYLQISKSKASGSSDNARFVSKLYTDLLGRSADSAAVSYWTSMMGKLGRAGTANAILGSSEFLRRQVSGYYRDILHRSSTPSQADLNFWASSGMDTVTIRTIFRASQEYMSNVSTAA